MAKKQKSRPSDRPKTVQLSREEVLELQLLSLQQRQVQSEATQKLQAIDMQARALGHKISQRLGVNIDEYDIAQDTGVATWVDRSKPQVEPLGEGQAVGKPLAGLPR